MVTAEQPLVHNIRFNRNLTMAECNRIFLAAKRSIDLSTWEIPVSIDDILVISVNGNEPRYFKVSAIDTKQCISIEPTMRAVNQRERDSMYLSNGWIYWDDRPAFPSLSYFTFWIQFYLDSFVSYFKGSQ